MRKRIHQHLTWVLLGFLIAPPCFATVVLEADKKTEAGATYYIEIIRGDEKVQRMAAPPLPQFPQNAAAQSIPQGLPDLPGLILRFNKTITPYEARQLANAIHLMSSNYQLDPRLLASLIAVESSFRPDAVSSSGAIGLGQLKPETAHWLGVQNPFEPLQNVMGAAKYLRYLLDRYNGNVSYALAAYFKGQGTIDRAGIDSGAQRYISKVNHIYSRF